MIHSLAINPLTSTDTDAIACIHERIETRWKMTAEEVDEAFIRPALAGEKLPAVFVARMGTEFAGKIFVVLEDEGYLKICNELWIQGLYVPEAFRGNGIGKALVERAKEHTKALGYAELYLDTTNAKGFYEKLGGWETLGTDYWVAGEADLTIMRAEV